MGISDTCVILYAFDLTYLVVLASFQELNRLPIHVSEHVLSCVILKLFFLFKKKHPECTVVFSTGPFQMAFPPGKLGED